MAVITMMTMMTIIIITMMMIVPTDQIVPSGRIDQTIDL
jgi:hypothetical protein